MISVFLGVQFPETLWAYSLCHQSRPGGGWWWFVELCAVPSPLATVTLLPEWREIRKYTVMSIYPGAQNYLKGLEFILNCDFWLISLPSSLDSRSYQELPPKSSKLSIWEVSSSLSLALQTAAHETKIMSVQKWSF